MSIPETKVIDIKIKEINPDVFMDIHSGMDGLLYPMGFNH